MTTYKMGTVETLLNAKTVVGEGDAVQVPHNIANHSWEIKVTGAPSACSVKLQGSLDETNWYDLDASTTTTSELRHIANKCVKYIKGNFISVTGGSPAPTVTVRWMPAN